MSPLKVEPPRSGPRLRRLTFARGPSRSSTVSTNRLSCAQGVSATQAEKRDEPTTEERRPAGGFRSAAWALRRAFALPARDFCCFSSLFFRSRAALMRKGWGDEHAHPLKLTELPQRADDHGDRG